jgi:hypothetical protein
LAEFYIGKRGFGQEKKDHEAKKILLPADGSLIMKPRSAPDPSDFFGHKFEIRNPKQIQMTKIQKTETFPPSAPKAWLQGPGRQQI